MEFHWVLCRESLHFLQEAAEEVLEVRNYAVLHRTGSDRFVKHAVIFKKIEFFSNRRAVVLAQYISQQTGKGVEGVI